MRGVVSGADWKAWLQAAAHLSGRDVADMQRQPAGQPREALPAQAGEAAVWEALTWLARRAGFKVEHTKGDDAASATQWSTHRIEICEGRGEPAVLALTHELGHVMAHGRLANVSGATTAQCGGIDKVEADSIAFIVAARLGLPVPSRSWPSVASWAGSDPRANPEAMVLAAERRIIRAAYTITSHLDVALFGRQAGHAASVADQTPDSVPRSEPARAPATARLSQAVVRRRGGPVPARELAPPEVLGRILQEAERFCRAHLGDAWTPGYLRSRGLGPADWQRWGIGYAPAAWTTLTDHLRRLGCDDALIEAAGLARRSSRGTLIDHFRDRVILPVRAGDGTTAGFIGRVRPGAAPTVPKYLNSPETPLYCKGDLLFGLSEGRDQLARGAMPVIVEGPFDAIAVTIADPQRYAGVAPCGTAITGRQLAVLASVTGPAGTGALVAFDGDRAGRNAAAKACELLLPHTPKMLAAALPTGSDPADLLQTGGPAALRDVLCRTEPLARVAIDAHLDGRFRQLDYPEGRLTAMRSAALAIARMLPQEAREAIGLAIDGRIRSVLDGGTHDTSNAKLSAAVKALPANATCQILRVAERTGRDCAEVTAEVLNAAARETTPPKGAGSGGRGAGPHSPDGAASTARSAPVAQASFPPRRDTSAVWNTGPLKRPPDMATRTKTGRRRLR
jgi:DNA primase